MNSYRSWIRFEEALEDHLDRLLLRRRIARAYLQEALARFERGAVSRFDAATALDLFEDGELRDPVSEALRIAICWKALALLAGWPGRT